MALPAKDTLGNLSILRDDYRTAIEEQRDQIAFLGTLWEALTLYPFPSTARGSDGILYDSKQPSTGEDPTLDVLQVYWTPHKSYNYPGDEVNLSYLPSAQQLLDRRMLQRNGASLLRTDFPELFSIIGVTYGNIDATHFNLPDDRGLFERIWDNGAGIDPDAGTRTDRGDSTTGDNVGTKQNSINKSHAHAIQALNGGLADGVLNYLVTVANSTLGGTSNQPIIDNGGAESRPVNIYKWGGIFY